MLLGSIFFTLQHETVLIAPVTRIDAERERERGARGREEGEIKLYRIGIFAG